MRCLLLRLLSLLPFFFLVACASYDGRGLQPGVATVGDVERLMGVPAMRWRDADGREQLAFPRGPEGVHTFMAFIGPDGRLERLENVLRMAHFAGIVAGRDDQAAILRRLGPPVPEWTAYYKGRDELVWEWLFCDDWNQLARFDVLFDGSSGLVRTTMQRPDLRGWDGDAPFCGH
ncbi:MAG: hypothetical protein F9K30_14580 [Dechloromonas sp.]|nr:MAG: hypothetical protein F9K30_14580 [Dechloromonas sp.]